MGNGNTTNEKGLLALKVEFLFSPPRNFEIWHALPVGVAKPATELELLIWSGALGEFLAANQSLPNRCNAMRVVNECA
ncbi:hypothetical protein COLO4_06003 [Corchorus olitorius]|uniref:Uncharacterized protein n=1 Tax=Corchorus olitorius TaxID=93759 RepID=A0A1R3KPA4_9ROSI|nr:hypothetical protein COLO4_06003 [Corchorus olitorius]